MADPLICDEICVTLMKKGPIKVETHGAFRHVARIHGSSKAVKRAVGSLIRRGVIRRHRPEPQGCSDVAQPITFELVYH